MDTRIAITVGVVGGLVLLLFAASSLVTTRPLEVEDIALTGDDRDLQYARTVRFSQPAIGGMMRFRDHCAGCHGEHAVGSDTAPSLLERAYSLTHLEREAFHTELAHAIPAHRALTERRGGAGLDFNGIEMLVKYLRELRLKGPPPPIEG